VKEMAAWPRGLGLGQHEAAFRGNSVGLSARPELESRAAHDLARLLPDQGRAAEARGSAPADGAERCEMT
jgi:hypothetical protein